MKKLFFALAVLLAFNYTNAQTCSSPILLDGFGGSFTPVDSFNVQDRFFKFTATNPHHKVKAYIKRLSTLGGNIYVNMYTNNCGSLPSSSLTLSPTTSGDTIIVDYSNFVEGTEYLVEIGKVVNNSSYVVYSLSASSSIASFTWSCGSCPSTNTVCDLVCNGSFECLSSPVNNWSGATNNTYANNWVSATLSSPDIFTSTTFTPYNVPCNAYGSETGKTGSNYAGINMGNGGYSEYLETQLVSPMQGSKKYIISFWVSKAEIPTALTKAIGIYLTNTPISLLTTTDILNSSYTPNAILTYTSMLNTTSGWTKISFCYNATGNEQYLTIGRPQGYTSATGPTPVAGCSPINNTLAGSMDTYSYMYIDDVSVTLFEVTAGATQTVNVCGTATLNSNFTCGSPTVGLTSINYSWGGTNGFSSASTNTTSNVITTTNFNITVTGYDSNNASCAATGTLAVISNTPNPITLTPSANTVCPGAAVTITATGSSATCTFNPGPIVSNSPTFNPIVTTTYSVTGTTTSGCVMTKTITIYTFTSGIGISASPSSICTGFSSTLTASNGVSGYTWQPSGTGTTIVVSPTITTTYTVTGVTSNGCTRTNTITVTVNNPSTLTISPATSNTICLNSSINLSASGATTYTWQPMNTPGSGITVSPTVATTYTVFGTNSFGCIGSKTVTVFVNSLPTVNCSTSNTTTCPGLTATLSASGASTYTWLPSTISSTVAVSPTVTTSYTVIGTSVLGCTNSCILTQSVFPTTVNFFTIVSTPSVICTLFPYNVTATLSVVGTPNYTWLPSGPSNTIITTTAPGIFSATATYTNGCIYTKTLNLAEPGPDPALNLIKVCNGSTLNLTSYTSPSGGTYSLNGVASSNTVGPLSPGTYTVNFTYTAGVVCNPNLTSTFVVLPTVVTPTISTTSTLICQTIPTITLTALPSTQSYTWLPMYSTGYTVAASPTVNTIYTVQVGTDALGNCGQTSTISIITSTAPCNCVNGCNTSLSGNLTTSPATNSVYCVTNNIQINGTVTFSNSDFRIYPLMSITIYSNAVLTITGSHLYSCDNMWQGIIVQQGGKLIINDGTRSSFIEDAYVAVDVYTTSTTYTATSILSVDNVTFNRNQIGIRIGDYTTSQSTYPFSIQNCLFTSRSIPFSALSYTNNTTIKNSASGNSSPLQTPYVSNSLYASANLKAPLATDYPSNGIVLNSVGYTIAYGNNWYGLAIGNSTNSAKFNCFDNLKEDITAYNTNVLISNNVFQNGVRYGRGSSAGGKAIVANSANVANNLAGARNNQIMINSVASTTNLGNYFYEKTGCADINGYINIEIKNNYVYSYANNYNLFTTLNAIGDHGFSVVTNRYLNITMQYNNIYNIKNAMLVGIDNSGYWNALGSSSTGRLVGNVTCSYNLVDRHPSTPSSAEFVNIGFSLDDPFSAATTTIVGSNSNVIQFNRMQNVHNAIAASNIAFCPVYAYSNTITMVNEPNTYYTTPIQTGINFTQILNTSKINKNNINGSSSPTYSPGVKAISTSGNAIMSVRCNTTAYTARGLEFNGVQTIDYLEDNTMSDQTYGFVLDNSAKLTSTVSTYVMGSASRPTNNVWLNSWTVNTKTGTFNSSSAQDGKLYVDFTSSQLDPNGSGYTDWIYGTTNYFHASHAASTLLNVTTTVTPSCRITGGGMGRMMNDGNDSNIVALLEQTTNDSIIFDEVSSEANFINKNTVYRTLKANIDLLDKSNSLSNFYASVQNSSLKNLSDIEEAFANSDLNSASTLIDGLNPSNAVETNYKNFYTIYKHTKDSTYNFNDSTLLSNLANACPYMSGGVVYQARAFYNILYTTYKVFYDNCNEVSARKANKPKQNIRVILKTEVYPNPNNGNYTIRFTNVLEKQNIEISIFDLSGKLLFKENKLISGNEINMSNNFINGAYTVKIKLPDGSYDLHKIIISK